MQKTSPSDPPRQQPAQDRADHSASGSRQRAPAPGQSSQDLALFTPDRQRVRPAATRPVPVTPGPETANNLPFEFVPPVPIARSVSRDISPIRVSFLRCVQLPHVIRELLSL